MPDSESTDKERASRILLESLEDVSIDEGSTSFTWSEYFQGRVEFYWETTNQGVVLIVESTEQYGGDIRAVVALDPIAENIAELFPRDDDAAMAWEDVFLYFLNTLDALPLLNMSLIRRSIGLRTDSKETKEEKMWYAREIGPIYEALEAKRLALFKQLRGEYRRGGSESRHPVSNQQCATIATEYPILLAHWKGVKKWRRESPDHWREHARVDFEDTPSDLLDRLDDKLPTDSNEDYPGIPSILALEHAARRSGLPANIYGSSTLKQLRTRGELFLGQMKKSN